MKPEEAEKHYQDYLEVVKTRKEKYLEDLKKTYYHLSEGRKVLDIYEVFKQSGVNENGEPKLAIAPANATSILLEKLPFGSATFTEHARWSKASKSDVKLPTGTFPTWKEEKNGVVKSWGEGSERTNVEAKVPVVPAHILPEGDLSNYYILFEVQEWFEPQKAAFRKGDPYLLKRINENAFAVLAEWDVTDVEAAVLRSF